MEPGQIEGYEMFEDSWEASSPIEVIENDQHGNKPQASEGFTSSPGEYTFPWHAIEACTPPSIETAKLALSDPKNLLHPHDKGCQAKITGLTSTLKKHLMWMEYFLHAFVNSATWTNAAL